MFSKPPIHQAITTMNKQQFIRQYLSGSSENHDEMIVGLWIVGAFDKLAQLGLIPAQQRGLHEMKDIANGLDTWRLVHDNKAWIDCRMMERLAKRFCQSYLGFDNVEQLDTVQSDAVFKLLASVMALFNDEVDFVKRVLSMKMRMA